MNGILLNNADTVITVTEDIPAGGPVSFVFSGRQKQIFATEPIPQYHKMAITDIKAKAEDVYKRQLQPPCSTKANKVYRTERIRRLRKL